MSENQQKKDILKWVIIGLIEVIIIISVLGIGIKIGEMKAKFSYRWAENYHKMFAGPKDGFLKDPRVLLEEDFIDAYGSFGKILEIKENEVLIKGKKDLEKIILINDQTIIKKGFENIKKESLKTGDFIVVIGSPNEEGKIEAKIIRVFPQDKGPLPFKGIKKLSL